MYAQINIQTGDVIQFPYSNTGRIPSPQLVLPEDAVLVDMESNKPADDWTKRHMFDQVIRDGDNYILTYSTEDRFDNTEDAVIELTKILQFNRRSLNKDFQNKADALTSAYSNREVESWDRQLTESKIYMQELTTDNTPLLLNIATARQIDVQELATRIITKAGAFAIAFGELLGKKQRNEDILATLEDDLTNQTNWVLLNSYGW